MMETNDVRKALTGKALDPHRQLRGDQVQGDMHWIREIRRVGVGGKDVTAEDRGKSGYNRGVALRVAWCGLEAQSGKSSRGIGGRKGAAKLTHNRAVVTCADCIEAEYKHNESGE